MHTCTHMHTHVHTLAFAMCSPPLGLACDPCVRRYANEDDLIPGLGAVSLAGGQLLETRARDLKDLYKVGRGRCACSFAGGCGTRGSS